MANAYYYSNLAQAQTLSGNISAGATSITVSATTGFPTSYPFVLAVDYGGAAEELVKVTSAAGTTLTVERGFGGTSAQSHSVGAGVQHVANAQDFIDFRTHEAATAGVHGVTGALVGVDDTQTLTNKTLTSPAISDAALSGTFTGNPTFSGSPTFTGEIVSQNLLRNSRALATDSAYETRVTGDSFYRWYIQAGGKMLWASGAATGDVMLARSQAGELLLNGRLLIDRSTASTDVLQSRVTNDTGVRFAIDADGAMFWGDGASTTLDTKLYRAAANVLATDDTFRVIGASGVEALQARVTGDTVSRFMVLTDGKVWFGPGGNVSMDTNLYRSAVDTLVTDDKFSALVETSTSFSQASGFSFTSASHRKTCGVCSITVYAAVAAALTPTSGTANITDTLFGTLPAGFRPASPMETVWSDGHESGSALIDTDGTITLRTTDYNQVIDNGANIRVSATFVL